MMHARTLALLATAPCALIARLPNGAAAQGDPQFPPPLELVAVSSAGGGEAFPTLTPSGTTLLFATHERGWTGFHIVAAQLINGDWSQPSPVSFDSPFNDRAPFVSPDGETLFFSSDRPLPGSPSTRAGSFNLWYVTRTSDGSWSGPRPVAGVNSRANDFHAAVTATGTLYFSSNRPKGYGQYDLYRAERVGDDYATPLNLGPTINTAGEETDVYVSPDESYLIVVATDRAGGVGGDDLWLSVREGDSWGPLANLGEPVNSSSYEYGPFVSPDGQHLYFTTHRRGLGDIVRVEIGKVPGGRSCSLSQFACGR